MWVLKFYNRWLYLGKLYLIMKSHNVDELAAVFFTHLYENRPMPQHVLASFKLLGMPISKIERVDVVAFLINYGLVEEIDSKRGDDQRVRLTPAGMIAGQNFDSLTAYLEYLQNKSEATPPISINQSVNIHDSNVGNITNSPVVTQSLDHLPQKKPIVDEMTEDKIKKQSKLIFKQILKWIFGTILGGVIIAAISDFLGFT